MLSLIGVLIVIIGFAMKKDSILIIVTSAIVTAILGKIGVIPFLDILGKTFIANRAMAIFVMIMLVTGTLERNGLKEVAAVLIKKLKDATPGKVIGAYGVMRIVFAAFNINFGGVAGFVCPIVYPMATASIEAAGHTPNEEHLEEVKGMASGMENIAWFFGQVLFIGGSGGLLVQSTLASLGYHVELVDLAKVELPVAVFALIMSATYYFIKDKNLAKKYY